MALQAKSGSAWRLSSMGKISAGFWIVSAQSIGSWTVLPAVWIGFDRDCVIVCCMYYVGF